MIVEMIAKETKCDCCHIVIQGKLYNLQGTTLCANCYLNAGMTSSFNIYE